MCIRDRNWVAQNFLLASNMTVMHMPEFNSFQLVYQSGGSTRSVVVRLTTPGIDQPKPIEIQVEGTIVANSVPRSDAAKNLLVENHAIVVEGRVAFAE